MILNNTFTAKCQLPRLARNMIVPDGISAFYPGQSFYIRCKGGYKLTGVRKIICGMNGVFSALKAICIPGELLY